MIFLKKTKQILQEFSVPESLNCKKEMDSNIKSLLLEKKAKETLSLDQAFCPMQEIIGNIFRPLPQIWDFLGSQKNAAYEKISQTGGDIPEDATEMFIKARDCCRIIDITITMIGQAFYSLPYYRCTNALMVIMDDKVKDMMSENKEIIQEKTSKRLLGEKFDEKITEKVNFKKKSREFFT